MPTVQPDLKYSKSHEWVKMDGDIATVGITDHAQNELGDITFVDLPETGKTVAYDGLFGEVESVKAVSDLISPVSGEVIEANTGIKDSTETINEDPFGKGWLIKVRVSDTSELSKLLSAADYEKFAEEGSH